jgi:hypothetical protein
MKTQIRNLLLLLFFSFRAFSQTILYVDGSKVINGNGTFANPFNKIMNAVWSTTTNSHVIINIRGGVYYENLWLDRSGLPNGYYTIQRYQNEQVILDGSLSTSTPNQGVIIQSASYVRVQNLIVRNFSGNFSKGIGIYCFNGNSSNIEILNNEVYNINQPSNTPTSSDNSNPIVVLGHNPNNNAHFISNILIANNIVHDCNTGYSEGIQVNYDTRNFEIRNNKVFNIKNIGIVAGGFHNYGNSPVDKKATNGKIWLNEVYNCKSPIAIAAGIYIDGAKNVVAERNIVYDCQKGMSINCETPNKIAENDTIRNNFIFNNLRGAINFGGNTASGKVINSAILNNSTFQNFNPAIIAPSPDNFGEITIYNAENSKVMNNIFHSGNQNKLLNCQYPNVPTNLVINNNNWYSDAPLASDAFRYFTCSNMNFTAYKSCSSQDQNSVYGNPYFQNGIMGNLRIRCASAAINIGQNAIYGGLTDYFGEIRKLGNNLDAGADEFERYKHQSNQTGNWLSIGTWQLNAVPLPCDEVQIKSGHRVNLLNGQNTSCKMLQIETNASVDCSNGANLSINPNN